MTESLWQVARTVSGRVRTFFDAPLPADARPLELLQAALDELERKTQPSGRGSRVFPYTRVVVHIAQRDGDRDAIEAVFKRLEPRLRERFGEIRCELPRSLAVSTSVAAPTSSDARVMWVECGTVADDAPAAAPPAPPEIRFAVVKGQCERDDYTFAGGGISIGRGGEPADAFGRVRRNDIAFVDAQDGVTETVARAHARVEFDQTLGAYVLFNESTSNPTFIVRGRRSLRIDPRDPRGVRLQSGDEIQLGRAVLKVC